MSSMLLLAVLLTGADTEVPLKEVEITLPETIGKFQYKGKQDYQKFGPGMGYSVGYANKMCSVSIYVYDRELKEIPAGKKSKLIDEELKIADKDLALAETKRVYSNLKHVEGELKLPKAVLDKFAAAGYTYDVKGGGCQGYVLVTGYHGQLVKIRVTQFVVDGKTNDEELDAFLEELAGHFQEGAEGG